MSDTKKFTDDELHQVKTFQEKYAKVTAELGQLNIQKHLLETEITNLLNTYTTIQTSEKEFANALTQKYGDGTLNLDSGEFIPNK